MPSRLKRMYRRVSGIYAGTGSSWSVGRFLVVYVWQKLPLLGKAAVAKVRRRNIQKAVVARKSADRPRILVHTLGAGVGDDIVIARFLRDLGLACGPLEFDIACNDESRSRWVFEAVPGLGNCLSAFAFDQIRGMYTMALRIGQVIEVAGDGGPMLERLASVRERLIRFASQNALFMQGLPYTSNDIARRAVYSNATRSTYLHMQAGISYGGHRLPLRVQRDAIDRFGLAGTDFVTVHNGFDPAFVISGRFSTKSYRAFDAVIARLKASFPGIKFVQVGTTETSTPLSAVDKNLVGKTKLDEVAAAIAASRLHIDIDSGLVHLAASLGVPSVVLFGPTDSDYFGYEANINLRPQFCGGCWWTSESWMDQCPRHFDEARCMAAHSPEAVSERISEVLAACSKSRQSVDT